MYSSFKLPTSMWCRYAVWSKWNFVALCPMLSPFLCRAFIVHLSSPSFCSSDVLFVKRNVTVSMRMKKLKENDLHTSVWSSPPFRFFCPISVARDLISLIGCFLTSIASPGQISVVFLMFGCIPSSLLTFCVFVLGWATTRRNQDHAFKAG